MFVVATIFDEYSFLTRIQSRPWIRVVTTVVFYVFVQCIEDLERLFFLTICGRE